MDRQDNQNMKNLDEFVRKYFDEIASTRWCAETKLRRWADYVKILSNYYEHVDIPPTVDRSFFEKMLAEIKQAGYMKSTVHKEYTAGKIRALRFFTWLVFVTGARLGLFPNILKGTGFYKRARRSDAGQKRLNRQQRRKSLTAREEYQLYDLVCSADADIGEMMSVLLQWVLGTRNSETAAITYGDVKPLEGHPGWHVIVIYATVYKDVRKRKSGGRTSNMYREIPIPEPVFRIIQRRRERIEALVEKGEITFPQGEMESIDDLPIANHGLNWYEFCLPHEVNDMVKKIFDDIHIDPKFLAFMHEEMERISEEDSLTAYVLRRNMVTHIMTLGLNDTHRRYLTGHDLGNKTLHRFIYSSPNELKKMCDALGRRPLVNDIDYSPAQIEVEKKASIEDRNEVIADITLHTGTLRMDFYPNEADDPADITLNPVEIDGKKVHIEGTYRQVKSKIPQKENVNVLKYYYDEYREAREWWENEKKKRAEKESQKETK